MKDILGREISDGSLVIGMTVDRHSDGMRFGIAQGESCVWKGWGLVKSSVSNVYLVENPSEQEFKIKQEILDEIHKEELANEQKKQQRKALKRIPTKQLVIGGYYADDKDNNWCYFGKATVKTTATDLWGNNIAEPIIKHGYCYMSSWNLAFVQDTGRIHDISVVKSPRKLVKEWNPEGYPEIDLNKLKWTTKVGYNRLEVVEIILD